MVSLVRTVHSRLIRTKFLSRRWFTYLLALDDGERTACALDAHIRPLLVQTVLEGIHCWSIDHMMWQSIPVTNNSCTEKCLPNSCRAPWQEQFQTVSTRYVSL